MKNRSNFENRIAGTLALGCYAFALTAVGVVAYAFMTLAAHLRIGQSLFSTVSRF